MRRSKDRKQEAESRPLAGSALAEEASERLAKIVNGAERAAEQVIDEAEGEAREIIAEAEAEAERIRGEALAAVERARRELGAMSAEAPAPGRGSHLSAVPASEPDAPRHSPAGLEPEPKPLSESEPTRGYLDSPPPERNGTPAGARLLATQMAVSGSSREEIEARLRSGFEIEDTNAILDAILGPEE